MTKVDVFRSLLLFQCRYNLPKWLEHAHIVNGRIQPKHGNSLEEGLDENPNVKGILVLENSEKLVERLREDGVVTDTIIPPWAYINGDEGFLNYLRIKTLGGENGKKARESAYVVDGKNGKVTSVREFSNRIRRRSLEGILYSKYLPKDFLSMTREIDPDDPDEGIGLKTRNAIRLTLVYPNVRTYQIKSTPYSNAGMGLVTEFGKDGLVRTVHMEHKLKENLHYINPEFQVVAVYREFERRADGLYVTSKRFLSIEEIA